MAALRSRAPLPTLSPDFLEALARSLIDAVPARPLELGT
jgi:hypothetical protein